MSKLILKLILTCSIIKSFVNLATIPLTSELQSSTSSTKTVDDILSSEITSASTILLGGGYNKNNDDEVEEKNEENQRTLISDIEKIITIGKIIQTFGEKVAPWLNETDSKKIPIIENLALNGAEGVNLKNLNLNHFNEHRKVLKPLN